MGFDYILNIPDSITLAPGETQLSYPIIPLSDGLPEGVETITITLSNNFGCGDIVLSEITVDLADEPVVDIFSGRDTAFVCINNCITMAVNGATDYFWEPVSIVDDPFSATPEACPDTSQWITVVGSIGALPGCTAEDSVYLQIIDPQMTINALDVPNICVGDSVHLQAVNNVDNQGLVWSPGTGLSNLNDEFVTASPSVTTTYTATVTLEGCSASDDFTVNVDAFDFPEITTFDTTICQGQSVLLAEQIFGTTTTYDWSPNIALDPSNDVSGPLATPLNNITYTLVATSQNAYCSETIDVDIEVIPAEVNVMPQDTVYICLGESTNLSATSTTSMVTWSPAEGLNSTTDLNVIATPDESTWYTASMSIGACTVMDSVFVRVDSIPFSMDIMALPDEDPYCPGDTVLLFSNTYEPNDFPDIEHLWAPDDNAQSPADEFNFVLLTTDTLTYYRTTTNNACSQTDSITLFVTPPTTIDIEPASPMICEGESVQLTATSPDISEFTWTPDDGTLTCLECPDPIATPVSTATYTVQGGYQDCPVVESVQIEVVPNLIAGIIEDDEICNGDQILLNTIQDPYPGTTYNWQASPTDPSLNPTDAMPLVSPSENTTYTVTITNGVCEPIIDEVIISVINNAIVSAGEDETICQGDTIILTATSTEPIGGFDWTDIDGNSIGQSASIPVSPNSNTTYIATFSNQCESVSDSVSIEVLQGVGVEIVVLEPDSIGQSVFEGQTMTLNANLDDDLPGASFTWSDGQTGQTIEVEAIGNEIINDTVKFCISVIVTSADGCMYEDDYCITVEPSRFQVPNVFTPNGDGTNDAFKVFYAGNIEIVEFKVFNRWGNLVYDNDDPQNGWDGTYKNELAPSDVYIYTISIRNSGGDIETVKGDVTLVR